MNKLLLILPITLLQGCFYQNVGATDLYYAERVCKDKGERVVRLREEFTGTTVVICTDGRRHDVDWFRKRTILKEQVYAGGE